MLGIIFSVPSPLPVPKYFCPTVFSLQSPQKSELLTFSVHVFSKCQIFTDLAAGTDLHTFLMAAPMWQVPGLLLPPFFYLWITLLVTVNVDICLALSWARFRKWFCLWNLKDALSHPGSVPISGSLHSHTVMSVWITGTRNGKTLSH